jgi:hypothetical protein
MDGKDVRLESKEQYDYYHPDNTAVAVIEVDEDGMHHITSLNDTSHLEDSSHD